MSGASPAVLCVDDERANLDVLRRHFDERFELLTAESGAAALALLEQGARIDVVVSDHRMPGMSGVELLEQVARRWPHASRMLLTAYSDRELLLDAIRRGQVHDFLLKPWEPDDVAVRLQAGLDAAARRRALAQAELERDALRAEVEKPFDALVGQAPTFVQVLESLRKVASTDATVLLRGETGTGKELLAREVHRRSTRRDGPFVRVNCSAFSESLLESELFGHEAGAFTGASKQRIGRFEQAHGGTLFLDEIGDVSAAVQVKLLRAIQERELERVGGTTTIRVDLRLVAATHRDLEAMVKGGRFREDLFFRLNVVPLTLPPLRARLADVEPLARHFLAELATELGRPLSLTPEASAWLCAYDWPGNVRELRNVLERAAVLSDGQGPLGRDDLVMDFQGASPGGAPTTSVFELADQREAARIREALLQANGSVAKAARLLDVPRTTLNDRLKKYGIQ